MNRRTFLTLAASALTGAGATILLQQLPAPAPTTGAAFMAATQPCSSSGPRLPECPSRRQIQEADLDSLLNWWGQYGAGVQAWRYRGVPRTYVREWLFYQWEIVAEEHIYG